MLDIRIIRDNPEKIKWSADVKGFMCDVDRIIWVDGEVRKLKKELQDIQTTKNAASKEIPKAEPEKKQKLIKQMSELKVREKEIKEKLDALEPELEKLLLTVPQIPADDVPIGKDESENVEIKRVGEIRKFDFEPLDHIELGKRLDIIDIPRGVKIAGTRSYFLKGEGALLHWAVLRFAVDKMIERGYIPLYPPVLIREKAMMGTGYLPVGEEQVYKCERDEIYLTGTAEVPVTAYYMDEILSEDDLPKKFIALSACFRREAGTYGKDTAGVYRIHQFDKVEQVIICKNDEEESKKFHWEILENAESILQALELPYRVVNVCTGDLGLGQVQKFDIETYMPSRNTYSETHSASRFHDFQARRLNLRYRDKTGKIHFCHTLNNTVIASPRILIAILELYQNQDGSVTIPKALRMYMNGMERIEPK